MDNLPKFPLYLIAWKDAQSDNNWERFRRIKIWGKKYCFVYDIGWIIKENKKHLILCSQIGEDNDFGNRTKIPIKLIVKRQRIKFKYNLK